VNNDVTAAVSKAAFKQLSCKTEIVGTNKRQSDKKADGGNIRSWTS